MFCNSMLTDEVDCNNFIFRFSTEIEFLPHEVQWSTYRYLPDRPPFIVCSHDLANASSKPLRFVCCCPGSLTGPVCECIHLKFGRQFVPPNLSPLVGFLRMDLIKPKLSPLCTADISPVDPHFNDHTSALYLAVTKDRHRHRLALKITNGRRRRATAQEVVDDAFFDRSRPVLDRGQLDMDLIRKQAKLNKRCALLETKFAADKPPIDALLTEIDDLLTDIKWHHELASDNSSRLNHAGWTIEASDELLCTVRQFRRRVTRPIDADNDARKLLGLPVRCSSNFCSCLY
jgi:hypothetical protein